MMPLLADIGLLLLRAISFIVGLYLVSYTVVSAVKTFVLPRASNTRIAKVVFRNMRRAFELRLKKVDTYEERDRVLALYAPFALLMLPVTWLTLTLIAYMFMFYGVNGGTLFEAFRISGSSLFTLGFYADVNSTVSLILEFSEAALGMLLTALLIAYLPTMYAAFSQREALVNMLEVRAGEPPSAVEMIQRVHRIRGLETLGELWERWELWFVQVEESHSIFAALVYFRSPQPGRSWVTAAGTVLDGAALMNSTVDFPHDAQADLTIRAGFLALRSIADFFRIEYDHAPKPTDPISISRNEFDEAYQRLHDSGVPLKPDRDQCWRDFAGWRVNYDRVLITLAAMTQAPYAQWSSDRSLPKWTAIAGSAQVTAANHRQAWLTQQETDAAKAKIPK